MALYNIAGLNVEMSLRYAKTIERAQKYLIIEAVKPDICVKATDEQLDAAIKKFKTDKYTDEYEYVIVGNEFHHQLLKFGGMMFHSSCVSVDGKAYLFSAKSGTGKSTHTKLWLKLLGDRAVILNDDKPALRYIDGAVYAYGTPFSGKDPININARAKVGGICFIERAKENSISRLSVAEAIPLILEQTPIRLTNSEMDTLLSIMDKLLSATPVYKLRCNMDISAAELSYNTMKSGETNG